ncbi:MAG: DUF4105 domain-containing protein [Gemmatimonadota bacterium]|jgi:hypothetical protein
MSKRRKLVLVLAGLLGLTILATVVLLLVRRPSLEREWDEDVRVLSGVEELPDGSVRLTEVRDWRYSRDAVLSKDYHSVLYDPSEVVTLWAYEQELGLGGRIAHTFLVFEFPERYGDDRWLGISVETRREVGETYSLVGGVLQKFEVTHIWAREEDLVRRRVEYLDYPLTRYRVTVSTENVARLFRQFVRETAELAVTPRWYNTLTTNCTSSLIRYVNTVDPGSIPWHYSFVFTGRTDEYLARLGYLDPGSAEHITRDWLAKRPLR